jgi:hypothetical protein
VVTRAGYEYGVLWPVKGGVAARIVGVGSELFELGRETLTLVAAGFDGKDAFAESSARRVIAGQGRGEGACLQRRCAPTDERRPGRPYNTNKIV